MESKEDYGKVLLRAAYDLLKKQDGSFYVLNLLEETVEYDNCMCDGYCLTEDIAEYLGIEEE